MTFENTTSDVPSPAQVVFTPGKSMYCSRSKLTVMSAPITMTTLTRAMSPHLDVGNMEADFKKCCFFLRQGLLGKE